MCAPTLGSRDLDWEGRGAVPTALVVVNDVVFDVVDGGHGSETQLGVRWWFGTRWWDKNDCGEERSLIRSRRMPGAFSIEIHCPDQPRIHFIRVIVLCPTHRK